MSVGDHQVDPPVVVVVEEARPEAAHGQAHRGQAERPRDIAEGAGGAAPEELVALVGEVRDEDVQEAVTVLVVHVDAHGAEGPARGIVGHLGLEGHVHEGPVAAVA